MDAGSNGPRDARQRWREAGLVLLLMLFVAGLRWWQVQHTVVTSRDSIAFLACVQIQAYLENPRFAFDLPLRLAGTRHRLAVWEAMQRIPAGETRTYGELARELGSSPRAVGGACGANPLPLVVPCHRVIAAGGAIGGFMGSRSEGFEIAIKRWLLEHEGAL